MNNREKWRPSKYVYANGRLRASSNPKEVSISSRLMANLIAGFYDENLRIHARGRLLDLGCGNVPLFDAYKNFVKENICVDWDKTEHKNEFLDRECDLSRSLPFVDGEFDTIILSDVLEHIYDPVKLWKEMSRVLSAGGKVLMNVPFYYWLHEQPHDYYRYTEFALRRFVESSGFRLVQLETLGGVPEIAADLFSKTIIRVPLLGAPLAAFAQWLTLQFIRTSPGRLVSTKTAKSFPLGYFLIAEKVR